MTCSHCGAQLREDSVYCPECGAFCGTCPEETSVTPEELTIAEAVSEPETPAEEIEAVVSEELPVEEPEAVVPEEAPAEETEPVTSEDAPAEETEPATSEDAPAEEPEAVVAEQIPAEPAIVEPEAPIADAASPDTCSDHADSLPVAKLCAKCGAVLDEKKKFCTKCGTPTQPVAVPKPAKQCSRCGTTLADDQMFCPKCGTSAEAARWCIRCGAPLSANQMFCSKCGTSQNAAPKRCVKCGAPLANGQMFCTHCGTSNAVAPVAPVMPAAPVAPVARTAPAMVAPVVVTPPVYVAPAAPVTPKAAKTGPGTGARIVLRLLSFLLCLCLTASLLLTIVVLDLRQMTDKENLARVISSTLNLQLPSSGTLGVDSSSLPIDNSGSLVQWVYDALKSANGVDMDATLPELEEFFEKSTAKDFLADKTASYLADFLNGTNETSISRSEIADLVNENADIYEEVFGEPVTPELREEIMDMVESANIDEIIQQEVIYQARKTEITEGYRVADLIADLNTYTSDSTLWALIAINALLLVLLFCTNWFRLSTTLWCAAIPLITLGTLLAVPTAILQFVPHLLTDSIGGLIGSLIGSIISLVAPVHYITLGAGFLLLIVSVIVRNLAKPST